MKYDCKFDPKRDLQAVVPDMAVDLKAAVENGVVLDTGTVADFNDIDSPASIVGRVRDCFDAFEAQRAILAAGKAAAAAAAADKAAAAAAAAAAEPAAAAAASPSSTPSKG